MFQYEFFDRSSWQPAAPLPQSAPSNFVGTADIECIRSSYWAEHCLECGEPACYSTCERFSLRADGRCKRFSFGIRDAGHITGAPYAAELQFRQWGKLETIVRDGVLAPADFVALHNEWHDKCAQAAKRMRGLFAKKRYPVDERQRFDAAKYEASQKAGIPDAAGTPSFLLQCYSYEPEPFDLFFEITDGTALVFRESVRLEPGFNQTLFDVREVFPGADCLRAKLYPANDKQAHIVLLFCEFVKLKNVTDAEGNPATTPADASAPSACAQAPAKKVKCVAWDLDNTTWDGILIESEPAELQLLPGVMETIKGLDARGILQIVASKNDETDVAPVLKRLGLAEYYVGIYANWNAKSSNLARAAADLNIGIDAFALIDDSPFERREVAQNLPMVRVYENTVVLLASERKAPSEAQAESGRQSEGNDGQAEKGIEQARSNDWAASTAAGDEPACMSEASITPKLLLLPEFDVPVTVDAAKRRQMYQTERTRKRAAAATGGDNLAFLKSCDIKAVLETPHTPEQIKRSYELLQRTNQLNLSGNRYEFDAFSRRLEQDETHCLCASCSDRFGSYGQVLYLEARVDEAAGELVVSEFAMSCRVAGKCLEAALSLALLSHFTAAGVSSIVLRGTPTARNGLLRRSFTEAGFQDESTEDALVLRLERAENLQNAHVASVSFQ